MSRTKAASFIIPLASRSFDGRGIGLTRRVLLLGWTATIAGRTGAIEAGDWTSPGLGKGETDLPQFVKTETGTRIQELLSGNGEAAQKGDVVVIDYVLRRSNGYFIYSTVEGVSFQPKDIPIGPIDVLVGSPDFIAGFEDALLGMKPGGRRRVVIQPERGYALDVGLRPQPPGFAAKRQLLNHSKESLLFEIELLRIRRRRTSTDGEREALAS